MIFNIEYIHFSRQRFWTIQQALCTDEGGGWFSFFGLFIAPAPANTLNLNGYETGRDVHAYVGIEICNTKC